MSDRTINFGESETEATYQIQDTDSTGGGNFVVAKDTNANTVLLQYDPATDTWEYAGDVDMNGGNVSEVGTLTADSVNTEEASISGRPVEKITETFSYKFDGTQADISFTDIPTINTLAKVSIKVEVRGANDGNLTLNLPQLDDGTHYELLRDGSGTFVRNNNKDDYKLADVKNNGSLFGRWEIGEVDTRRPAIHGTGGHGRDGAGSEQILVSGGSEDGFSEPLNTVEIDTDVAISGNIIFKIDYMEGTDR